MKAWKKPAVLMLSAANLANQIRIAADSGICLNDFHR